MFRAYAEANTNGLNPCCNGMTIEFGSINPRMQPRSRLNPCCNGMTIEYKATFPVLYNVVLILVVME